MSVISLKSNDFSVNSNKEVYIKNSSIAGTPGILLVHASWCGHCVRFKPLFKELSVRLGNNFKCAEIENSHLEGNDLLRSSLGIKYFPTLKFFDQNGKIIGTYDDSNGRDLVDIMKYICDMYHHCIMYH